MNPTFQYEAPSAGKARKPRFEWLWKCFRLIGRLLMASPFKRRAQFRNEEGTRLSRVIHALTYRLAFVPIILVGFLTALVFAATHPGRPACGSDPLAFGIYYDPVNFVAEDGVRLEGWLIPVLDAKRVIAEGANVLNKRYPAVVLVHDFAASRDQLMPLAEPLHKAGFVVLAINLRGAASLSSDAQTFGIREAMDVRAAVEMLRRRQYVDPSRVALVGLGTGANASLLAARSDPAITTLVLSAPVENFDQALGNRIGSDRKWLPTMRPLLRWTFQVMYGVETQDLELKEFAKMMDARHVHMTDGRQGLMDGRAIAGVTKHLNQYMNEQVATTK
jgi:pimeloyl-ACP methyl ester carboxylesterase